jgi:hypothetical protein
VARLCAEIHRVGALLGELSVDEGLCACDLGPECIARSKMVVALGGQGVDGGVHFVGFGSFFGEGLLVGVGFDLENLDVFLFHALVLFGDVSNVISVGLFGYHTMNFCNVHAELIALLEDTLASCFYEVVEFDGEFGHAVAQLVEPKVDRGEGVCH